MACSTLWPIRSAHPSSTWDKYIMDHVLYHEKRDMIVGLVQHCYSYINGHVVQRGFWFFIYNN